MRAAQAAGDGARIQNDKLLHARGAIIKMRFTEMQLRGSRERCFHIHHLNNISQTCVCHTRARGDDTQKKCWRCSSRESTTRSAMTKEQLFIQYIHYVIYARAID
jgi:hypothetical protein